MSITNWFTPEQLIVEKIRDLFPENMIYVEAETAKLNNKIFNGIDNDDKKVAALVVNTGFIPGSIVGKNEEVKQRITQLYQVSIATPRDLYMSNSGALIVPVIARLNGQRLSPEVVVKKLADDKQYSNRPEYENDLAYLPIMFEVEFVI